MKFIPKNHAIWGIFVDAAKFAAVELCGFWYITLPDTLFRLKYILFFAGFVFCLSWVHGQSMNEGSHVVDARIDFKGSEISGAYVVINYEIPYSGIVEIRLFNPKGEKIWQSQYSNKWGENKIVLKATKFEPGEVYAFTLNYKRDEVRDLIIVPEGLMFE